MISFSKYQGAGNDFILVDDRDKTFALCPQHICRLCHRQYGIGGDGFILLQPSKAADYKMRIFNADGEETEMCGNGLRCLVSFLRDLGIDQSAYQIEIAGKSYFCRFKGDSVVISMGAYQIIQEKGEIEIQNEKFSFTWVNTGVPHLVCFVESLEIPHFLKKARALRSHPYFSPSGVNVNFAKMDSYNTLRVRTYERGVERETLSCGTGATAVCVAAWKAYGIRERVQVIFSSQERLEFDLLVRNEILEEMNMSGPVTHVFTGKVEI